MVPNVKLPPGIPFTVHVTDDVALFSEKKPYPLGSRSIVAGKTSSPFVGAVTLMSSEPVRLPDVAVMCAVPGNRPTNEVPANCATLDGETVKAATAGPITFPLPSANAAEIVALSPTLICALLLRTTRRRAVGATMNVAASDFPSIDAVIVTEPARFATATP